MLNKDQIIAARDIKKKELEIPEWGGSVTIQGLSAEVAAKFKDDNYKDDGSPAVSEAIIMANLAALTIVGENGGRVFDDESAKELSKKSVAVIKRIFDVAADLSGLGADDVEDEEKNS